MTVTLTAFVCLLATNECKSVPAQEHFISMEACDKQIESLNDPKANEILTHTGIVVLGYTCASDGG